MTLVADVPNPSALRPVFAGVRCCLLGLDRRPRLMIGSAVWAKPLPADCQERCAISLGCALSAMSRIIQPPSIQPTYARSGLSGGHDQRVHADAGIERRDTRRRRFAVAFACTGQPPAAGFSWMSRVAHVDDQQELIVQLVPRREVARAGGQIGVVAVGEPYEVDAAGMRAGCVEVRELRGCLRIRDVIHIDAGAGLCHLLRLVRHHQRVPGEAERVAADVGSLDLELGDDGRLSRGASRRAR